MESGPELKSKQVIDYCTFLLIPFGLRWNKLIGEGTLGLSYQPSCCNNWTSTAQKGVTCPTGLWLAAIASYFTPSHSPLNL
jgi:hypothetical protein